MEDNKQPPFGEDSPGGVSSSGRMEKLLGDILAELRALRAEAFPRPLPSPPAPSPSPEGVAGDPDDFSGWETEETWD